MAYCRSCGAEMPDQAPNCPRCGQASGAQVLPGTPAKSVKWPLLLILVPIGCFFALAVIGIIAALLIPNFLDALQKAKTKRTVADMRMIGSEWESWLTEQGLGPALPAGTSADMRVLGESISGAQLAELTGSARLQAFEWLDGWKKPLEVRMLQTEDGDVSLLIRSAGSDGQFDADAYQVGSFDRSDYAQDLVWMDGVWIRLPEPRRP